MSEAFQIPGINDRVALIGSTGSGKTQAGSWILRHSPLDRIPYVVLDYKHDRLFSSIDRIREIGLNEVPRQPGLYVIRPVPEADDDEVNRWLLDVLARTRIGLLFDESYMLPSSGIGVKAILTQGRAKHIPIIAHTQRPLWVSKFILSEASHFAVFRLTDREDRRVTKRYVPQDVVNIRLPKFHSHWYSVGDDYAATLGPVPPASEIIEAINSRLEPKRRWL